MNIDQKLKDAITNKVNSLGYDLYELTYKKENGDFILRVIIDKDEIINIDDIEVVSTSISELLDELDPIKENYYLDVTSLGAEKPLDINKLDKYVNKYVTIHLNNPYKGENNLEGEIVEVNNETLTLKIKNKSRYNNVTLSRKEIDRARLAIKF